MIKRIHLKVLNFTIEACWIRSSNQHKNIQKKFGKSENEVTKLITWINEDKEFPLAKAILKVDYHYQRDNDLVVFLKEKLLTINLAE